MPFNKALFDTNFTFAFKAMAANNIRIATRAFDSFWKDNHTFLNNADELYGHILAYAVKQQFIQSAPSSASAFLVSSHNVNAYKANAVFLDTSDYTTTVCRTGSPFKLPCKAAYKLKLASGNKEYDTQLELFADPITKDLQITEQKKYAILSYRYFRGKLEHLNILVPDWKFETILHSENLMYQINDFFAYIPEELVEENVTSLKKEIVQGLKNII